MSSSGTIGSSTKARILQRLVGQMTELRDELIAERIRAARKRAGISQEELARRLDLSTKTVWEWEHLQNLAFRKRLDAIADAIDLDGVTAEWLDRGDDALGDAHQTRIDELTMALDEARLDELRGVVSEIHADVREILRRLDRLEAAPRRAAGGSAERAITRGRGRRRQGLKEVDEAVTPPSEAAG